MDIKSSIKSFMSNHRQAIKWVAVAAVWGIIILCLLVGWYASELPQVIKDTHFDRRPAVTFKAADGSTIDRYGDLKGQTYDAKQLPPYLVDAVLATEDRRFYEHHGVDPIGMLRAAGADMLHGHVVQGGSTITQQLAKNLFLSRDRTFKRKIQEMLLAIWLEHRLTKDEILSAYLNRVYLGNGTYGVDAAAHLYFNKSARDLNLRESATLAGMLKAPSRYSPENNPGLAAQRAKVVLGAMADAGYITKKQAARETLSIPTPHQKPGEGGGVHYFTDYVAGELDELIGGVDQDMTVKTTLDPQIQADAEKALASTLRARGDAAHVTQGAIVVMDHQGAIVALIGGRDYDASQFNRATQSLRPTGSAFKPFVYLTALSQGWKPTDMIDGGPITTGSYQPENFNQEYPGIVTLEQALAQSLNTAAVRLAQAVGIGNVITTAHRLGIRAELAPELSTALGSNGIPPLEMATAYATLGNGGRSVTPHAVNEIINAQGELIYQRDTSADGMNLYDSSVIAELDGMLEKDIQEGTGTRAALPFEAAGKTGTSQDFRDAWFVGYTQHFVTAVWLGNDDNSPMKGITGGMLPAQVWHDIMLPVESRYQQSGPTDNNSDRQEEAPGVASQTPQNLAPTDNQQPGSERSFSGLLHRLFN